MWCRTVIAAFFILAGFISSDAQPRPLIKAEAGPMISFKTFNWSIAGDAQGKNPNILSELIYKNVAGIGPSAAVEILPFKRLGGSISWQKAFTIGGAATDADYNGDNRTGRYHFTELKAKSGFSRDFTIGLNYDLVRATGQNLQAGAGYFNTRDNMKTNLPGVRTINSVYKGTFSGIYLQAMYNFSYGDFLLGYGLEGGVGQYRATADWIDIETVRHPVSFEQHAAFFKSFRAGSKISLGYRLNERYSLIFNAGYRFSASGKGKDVVYNIDDSTPLTRFNGAEVNSFISRIGLQYTPQKK